jgi:hypothetical protein
MLKGLNMANHIRCYACNGNKEYSPLGFIAKKCGACGGLGYKIPVDKAAVNLESALVPETVQKKRGRPKSNSN